MHRQKVSGYPVDGRGRRSVSACAPIVASSRPILPAGVFRIIRIEESLMVACGSLCKTSQGRASCKELVGAESRCSCRLPQFWQLPRAVDARDHVTLSTEPPRPAIVFEWNRSRSSPRAAIGSNDDGPPLRVAATNQPHRAVSIQFSIAA